MNYQDFLDENEILDGDDEPITPLDISQPKKAEEDGDGVIDTPVDPTPIEDDTAPRVKPAPKKKKSSPKAKSEKAEPEQKKETDPNGLKTQFISIFYWLLAFLSAVFLIANIWENAGPLIEGYATLLYGLFGWGALFVILLLMLYGLEWKHYVTEKNAASQMTIALGGVMLISAIFHVIMIMVGNIPEPEFLEAFLIGRYWYQSRTIIGGGIFGGLLGSIFYSLMHGWVSLLILALMLGGLVLLYFRLTPEKIMDKLIKASDKRKKKKEEAEELRRVAEKIHEGDDETPSDTTPTKPVQTVDYSALITQTPTPTPKKAEETPKVTLDSAPSDDDFAQKLPNITVFTPPTEMVEEKEDLTFKFDNIPDLADGEDELDTTDFGYGLDDDDDMDLSTLIKPQKIAAEDGNADEIDPEDLDELPDSALDALDDLLDEDDDDDDDSLVIGGDAPVRERPAYTFPPIDLLAKGDVTEKVDNRDELLKNGQKLVDVLKSFRVDTDIVNIACGPTVTRYELSPKSGVRVRAIANLVDDIALNLETSGVRIEAPIPGKAAVGVEVPNKEAATVYLRDLIESDAFQNAKSKLTACVGMDVSGAPILMDIAKMPHLLIAGATGMGKSVGVNSIIMSLLYKATPDELKLILVDPKKVELNLYNKLPHLLIPVVNNPKKAAGALATAVNEMERRFELIESVGARNIKGYNKMIENDPTKEQLPSIVIIIDELADLMMTAKDDVEDSICRIAQKARAAGIHLIICTQRPSVDVITGLIKANVPSRIAFPVASNIDSRTIIDVAGAEKLIGRGDMLFAPVGAMKPIRVQGAFVDDKEVEAVTDFIKNQSKEVKYDDSFLNMVEVEAERCGQQKKKVTTDEIDSDDELDPKFYEAVELAVDMGKISTSLLQRKLSLGYGRAAKIIDSMESMGIVGAPDGQKPRNCLISRQEYQEMILHRGE